MLLWADPDKYDTKKIGELLETEAEKYLPIVSIFFEDQTKIPEDNNVIIAENFYFDDPEDPLSWYAHYRTEEFRSRIVKKIDRFRKGEKVTELLRELNEKAKK